MSIIRQLLLILISLVFICELSIYGEDKYNLSEFGHESVTFFKTPAAHWNSLDWVTLGVVAGSTLAVFIKDQYVRDLYKLHFGHQNNILMTIGEQYGGYVVVPLLPVLLYTTGNLANSDRTKKIGFEMAQAVIYSEVISFASKTIIGRSRPANGLGPFVFKPFSSFTSPYNSLPSGHSTAAVALSTVLAKNTDSFFLKILAYTPAALSIIQRVYSDHQWSSDVFVGAAIGFYVGNWIVNLHDQKESPVTITSLYPLGLSVSLDKIGK